MKIGLSYSRCIKDIIEGRVDINDVLVIISRTNFDPNDDDEWRGIWFGYTTGGGRTAPEWIEYAHGPEGEAMFRDMTMKLYNSGKIHQPRKFGAYPTRRSEYWLEAVLPSEELDRNPAAKKAWEQFQVVANLSNVKLDKDYD